MEFQTRPKSQVFDDLIAKLEVMPSRHPDRPTIIRMIIDLRREIELVHVHDPDLRQKRRIVEGQDILTGRQKQRLPEPDPQQRPVTTPHITGGVTIAEGKSHDARHGHLENRLVRWTVIERFVHQGGSIHATKKRAPPSSRGR
jgi:hypothetical protein